MAGLRPVFEKGPLTFPASTIANGGNIRAGMFVMPDAATGRIRPTTGAVATCLGLAIGDAAASDFSNADTVDTWNNPIVNAQFPPNELAVAYQGVWRLVNPSGATVAFGALIVTAANGAWAARAAETLDLVVGRCVEPGGIANGARGKILLGTVGS